MEGRGRMVISLQMQIQALPEELKRFSKILPENKKLKNWGCRSVQRPQVQSPVPLPKTPNTHTHTSTNIHLVGAKAVKYFLGTYCFQFVFLREKKQKKRHALVGFLPDSEALLEVNVTGRRPILRLNLDTSKTQNSFWVLDAGTS